MSSETFAGFPPGFMKSGIFEEIFDFLDDY